MLKVGVKSTTCFFALTSLKEALANLLYRQFPKTRILNSLNNGVTIINQQTQENRNIYEKRYQKL